MNATKRAARVLVILALVIILAACSAPATPMAAAPTQDLAPVRTEAAATVIAKITIQAALQPSATPEATLEPPEPIVITATPAPATLTAETPDEPEITEPTATPTSAVAAQSGTSGSAAYPPRTPSAPDNAAFILQSPVDGTVFSPGEDFDATWTIMNTGTTTWTTNYSYRLSGGTDFAVNDYYGLKEEVKPGERITLVADMEAPSQAGRYTSNWDLRNENGDVFFRFYITIVVN